MFVQEHLAELTLLIFLAIFSFLVCFLLSGSFLLRWLDHNADAAKRARLIEFQPINPARFDASLVTVLPEPARRKG